MQGHTSCLSTLPARPARLIACTPRVSSPLPRRLRVPQPASIRGWGCIFPHLRGGAAGGGRGEGVAHGEDDVVYLARVARGPELRRERVEPHKVRRARRRRREKKLPRPPRPHRHPVTTGPRSLAPPRSRPPPHTHTPPLRRPSAAAAPFTIRPLCSPSSPVHALLSLKPPSTLCSPSSPLHAGERCPFAPSPPLSRAPLSPHRLWLRLRPAPAASPHARPHARPRARPYASPSERRTAAADISPAPQRSPAAQRQRVAAVRVAGSCFCAGG